MPSHTYSRRSFLKTSGLGTAAALTSQAFAGNARSTRRPNIVFFLIDDMGWKDTGFMGTDFYETPNVDRLASQGVVFTNAYANAPNCAPTRACLMSGQYGPRHGVYTVGSSERGRSQDRKLIPVKNSTVLPADRTTIAESLHAAGYATFHGGKWHLGEGKETGPLGQGFDENIGGCAKGSPPGGYFAPWKAPNLEDAPKGAHLCDFITDHALDFIERQKEGPFFVYLPYYDVHTPLQAKKDLIEKYRKKLEANRAKGIETQHDHVVYAAMVENTDTNIGRVLRKLEETGVAGDTVVVFFSDNGGFGGATNMRPLRGCKGMLYEGGIREPMIVKWPGVVEGGTTCDVPAIGIDFYPTLVEIAGAKLPQNQTLDGESLVPLLRGGDAPDRDAIFWHFPCYLQGIPKGFRDDSHDGLWRTTPCSVIRMGDWKLHEYFEDGAIELYNLADDIGERNNLADSQPDERRELHDRLKQWRKEVDAPIPTRLNPEYKPT